MESSAREKKRCLLTNQDIHALPEDTKMYQSVGKMFLSMSRKETTLYLNGKTNNMDEECSVLESRKVYLQRQKVSLSENINELFAQCGVK